MGERGKAGRGKDKRENLKDKEHERGKGGLQAAADGQNGTEDSASARVLIVRMSYERSSGVSNCQYRHF